MALPFVRTVLPSGAVKFSHARYRPWYRKSDGKSGQDRIEDLKVVARHFGLNRRQHGTSHVIFRNGAKTAPVPVARPILPLYVKAFLKLLED